SSVVTRGWRRRFVARAGKAGPTLCERKTGALSRFGRPALGSIFPVRLSRVLLDRAPGRSTMSQRTLIRDPADAVRCVFPPSPPSGGEGRKRRATAVCAPVWMPIPVEGLSSLSRRVIPVEITKQVTVFLENKPGRLANVLSALAREKVNITALSV